MARALTACMCHSRGRNGSQRQRHLNRALALSHATLEPVSTLLSCRIATDQTVTHLGRAIAASALVAAWDGGVRLGVDKADDARRLTTDG